MKKKIKISKEVFSLLKKEFGRSKTVLYEALSFVKNHEEARKIRNSAIKHGGQVYVTLLECETIFCHNGIMAQTFPNGVTIELEMSTGYCRVSKNEKMLWSLNVNQIPELEKLQAEVSAL